MPPLSIRPLIVFRAPGANLMPPAKIRDTAQVIKQLASIQQFAYERHGRLLPFSVIRRTNAVYLPGEDTSLLELIAHAAAENELLTTDDAFRLLDCRDGQRAMKGFAELIDVRATIFSVAHGCTLYEIPKEIFYAQLRQRLRASKLASERISSGLEMSDEASPPTGRAIERAARAKDLGARIRADKLIRVIDRIRSEMPAEAQSNSSAVAKMLNREQVPTPSGKGSWQGNMVRRVYKRLGRTFAD